MFHRFYKHLKFRQKYSAVHHIFNSLFGVWKWDETLSLVFDKLHKTLPIRKVFILPEEIKVSVLSKDVYLNSTQLEIMTQ